MNRKQKRETLRRNLSDIKIKQRGVARVQANKFIKLAAYINEHYGDENGVPDEEIKQLIEGTHENQTFQTVFNEYKEAKKAAIFLSALKKNLKENGIGEIPKTKQEVLGLDVSEAISG